MRFFAPIRMSDQRSRGRSVVCYLWTAKLHSARPEIPLFFFCGEKRAEIFASLFRTSSTGVHSILG